MKTSLMPCTIAAAKFFRLGDGALAAGQIDNFRNGEDAEGDENKIDALPEIGDIECKALDAGFRVQADGGNKYAENAGEQGL